MQAAISDRPVLRSLACIHATSAFSAVRMAPPSKMLSKFASLLPSCSLLIGRFCVKGFSKLSSIQLPRSRFLTTALQMILKCCQLSVNRDCNRDGHEGNCLIELSQECCTDTGALWLSTEIHRPHGRKAKQPFSSPPVQDQHLNKRRTQLHASSKQ